MGFRKRQIPFQNPLSPAMGWGAGEAIDIPMVTEFTSTMLQGIYYSLKLMFLLSSKKKFLKLLKQ